MTKNIVASEPEFYYSLYQINSALGVVTEHLRKLGAAGVLPSGLAEIHRVAAEQMRSEINQLATNRLNTQANDEAYRFEQRRLELLRALNSADHVVTGAEASNPGGEHVSVPVDDSAAAR